jgi:TPR repeat protein/uncharacterized caspase-like protein
MRSTRVLIVMLAGAILAPWPTAHAQADPAGRRYALVIGNADYADRAHLPRLSNSLNDATSMELALSAAGFEVTLVKNATRRDINRAVEKFSEQIARESNSTGLFYYAGHGAQDNGLNYLIPVDAKVEYASDLETDGFDVRHVLEAMKEAHNQMNLIILDACRDNDLPRKRGGLRGLAKVDAPSGTFVAYAAAPGQGAYDGTEGQNGVFTGELLKAMQLPGVPLEQMFKKVIAGVKARTHGAQEPWSEASIQGEFYFIEAPKGSSLTTTQPSATGAASDAELLFWQSIGSDGTPADYQAYLNQYPNGRFTELAKARAHTQRASLATSLPPSTAPTPSGRDLELVFWQSISGSSKPEDYQTYLNKYPMGRFVDLARQQLASLHATAADGPWKDYQRAPPASPARTAEDTKTSLERGLSAYRRQAWAEAMTWLRRAADQGDAHAQYSVGILYRHGWGIPQDYSQAMVWYRKAADQGWTEAQSTIGDLYLYGWGVPQDYQQAMAWYRKAADRGDSRAESAIGDLYVHGNGGPQDYTQAMAWYLKAANQGEPSAQYGLGRLYDGGLGVHQDYAQARSWYLKAANQGYASAEGTLGTIYMTGQGVPVDYGQAMTWFQKAAVHGSAAGQSGIGFLYEHGLGVSVNLNEARRWYQMATDQGSDFAKQQLSQLGR